MYKGSCRIGSPDDATAHKSFNGIESISPAVRAGLFAGWEATRNDHEILGDLEQGLSWQAEVAVVAASAAPDWRGNDQMPYPSDNQGRATPLGAADGQSLRLTFQPEST
jgi:hypothetical protein